MTSTTTNGWHPVSKTLAGTMVTAITATAVPLVRGLPWWAPAVAAVFLAAFAFITGTIMVNNNQITGWRVSHLMACLVGAGSGASWIARTGWSPMLAVVLVIGAVGMLSLSYAVPAAVDTPQVDDGADRRPTSVQRWEALLRQILGGKALTVVAVTPWEIPEDGDRVVVMLPATGELTVDLLADGKTRKAIATALRLPHGCDVSVLDGDHQGEVLIDVMKRNTLLKEEQVDVDTSPVSINDSFRIMRDAKGHEIKVCLRQEILTVGGAIGSGKTTFLDYVIMRLEQCTDALIWTMDLNGGGLAETHLRPYAFGTAPKPGLDWVAGDPYEALAMTAGAVEIGHDRKTCTESIRRRIAANTKLLPVDADMPAIVIMTDELAELQKRGSKASINSWTDQRIEQAIQIGRAEGVRVVLSILRGTTDVANRGSKVQSSIRMCLKMNENTEYGHVLGLDPGKMRLTLKGQGWVLRDTDSRPLLARTFDVLPDAATRQAAATTHLRPTLDQWGQDVLARLRLVDIFPEALIQEVWDNAPELADDIEHGRLYTNRWGRARPVLDRIGGTATEKRPAPPSTSRPMTSAKQGSQAEKVLFMLGQTRESPAPKPAASTDQAGTPAAASAIDDGDVDQVFSALIDPEQWARTGTPQEPKRPTTGPSLTKAPRVDEAATVAQQIIAALREAYPDAVPAARLSGIGSKQRRSQVLEAMERRGTISRSNGMVQLLSLEEQ